MRVNMKPPLIKICGIKNTTLMEEMQALGVHFIGIIFHSPSKRYVGIETAKKIAHTALQYSLIPVGVFVDQTAEEIKKICEETGITTVQLHGERCKQTHHLLPDHYHRIYVQSVDSEGKIIADKCDGLKYCHPERDFLMFDYIQPGSGQSFAWENFSYQGLFKWFLAGGLTPQNVGEAVDHLHPDAVDVSSGVENSAGEKDIKLIREFILKCHPEQCRGIYL